MSTGDGSMTGPSYATWSREHSDADSATKAAVQADAAKARRRGRRGRS
ncbi:hypothetical protein STENM36S_06399 [Streptomyces tendae]